MEPTGQYYFPGIIGDETGRVGPAWDGDWSQVVWLRRTHHYPLHLTVSPLLPLHLEEPRALRLLTATQTCTHTYARTVPGRGVSHKPV